MKAGKPIVLAPWTPPVVDFEVSYDIENTPEPFVYLHGFLTRPAGSAPWGGPGFTDASFGTFDAVCAVHPQAEEDVWRCFLARVETLQALGSYAVYVYSSHERSTLRRLARTYGGSGALDHFLERMVDLRRALARTVVLPTDGDSLKAVAQFLGFTWRDGDPGGGQSIAWWSAYWSDPAGSHALRDRVLSYNEDDVRASFVVRDWLTSVAAGEVRLES